MYGIFILLMYYNFDLMKSKSFFCVNVQILYMCIYMKKIYLFCVYSSLCAPTFALYLKWQDKTVQIVFANTVFRKIFAFFNLLLRPHCRRVYLRLGKCKAILYNCLIRETVYFCLGISKTGWKGLEV